MAMNYHRPGQLGNTNVDTVQLELEITAKDSLVSNLDKEVKPKLQYSVAQLGED